MSAPTIPALVTEAATRQRFGRFVAAQHATTRRADILGTLLAFAVGALALAGVMVAVSMAVDSRQLGFLALGPLGVGIACLGLRVRQSLQRAQNYYLFHAGLVYHVGRRPRAIAWSEIAGLTRQRGATLLEKAGALASYLAKQGVRPDSVVGYELALKNGRRLSLKVGDLAEEHVHFCRQLEFLAPQAGVVIHG